MGQRHRVKENQERLKVSFVEWGNTMKLVLRKKKSEKLRPGDELIHEEKKGCGGLMEREG